MVMASIIIASGELLLGRESLPIAAYALHLTGLQHK